MYCARRGTSRPDQFLDSEDVRDVVGERRKIVQPVGVGDEFVVGAVLGDLFVAAVQVAQFRDGRHDGLTVKT